AERCEIVDREGVDEEVLASRRNLQQADPIEITMVTRRLRIDAEQRLGSETSHELCELFGRLDVFVLHRLRLAERAPSAPGFPGGAGMLLRRRGVFPAAGRRKMVVPPGRRKAAPPVPDPIAVASGGDLHSLASSGDASPASPGGRARPTPGA